MPRTHPHPVNRRQLLRWLAAPAALSLALRGVAVAGAAEPQTAAPRVLSLHNLHTGERLSIRYSENGRYLPGALAQCSHLLRDHRSGETSLMDPLLFDQLHALAMKAGREPRYEVISGYRSPQTNEALRAQGNGVAQRSLHTEGRAIDVRLAGTTCSRLRDLALDLRSGGVGYYAKSDFVHLDTGRVRSWAG